MAILQGIITENDKSEAESAEMNSIDIHIPDFEPWIWTSDQGPDSGPPNRPHSCEKCSGCSKHKPSGPKVEPGKEKASIASEGSRPSRRSSVGIPIRRFFNPCFCFECCCTGYSLIVGMVVVGCLELAIQMIFLTYPVAILAGLYPSFYLGHLKSNDTDPKKFINPKTRSYLNLPLRRIIIYESTQLFGVQTFYPGISPLENNPGNRHTVLDDGSNSTAIVIPKGLSNTEMKFLSEITVFLPLTLCIIMILGAGALLMSIFLKNKWICIVSFTLQSIDTFLSIIYMGLICSYIEKTFRAYGPNIDISSKFQASWHLWIELLYFLFFFPLAFFGTLGSVGLMFQFLNYEKRMRFMERVKAAKEAGAAEKKRKASEPQAPKNEEDSQAGDNKA